MKEENRNSIIIIAVIVLFSLGSTYAFLTLSISDNSATGEGGCFEVNYTGGQEINNSSLASTEDYTEGASTEVVLSKNKDCKIYSEATIYIHTNDETTAPIDTVEALKYVVMNGSDEVESGTITQTGDTPLTTVTLTETETTYTIYIWIDSNVSSGTYNGTTYSGYIYANSTQTSTITESE